MSSKSVCTSEIVVLADLLQRDSVADAGDEDAESWRYSQFSLRSEQ
jgi:hypothetical protein